MKTPPINLSVFILALSSMFLITAFVKDDQDIVPVVRAQKFELVDEKGKVHASMKIEENGETVFRLMDTDGTIRVKLGASRDGSGFVLLNDATEPGLHILAKKDKTSLTLTGKDGKKKELIP